MSRADAAQRITRAAITLGAARGVGALSLQRIADAAGVSKALLLYHFKGKAALLDAVVGTLGRTSAARLRAAAAAADPMRAWRALVRVEAIHGELALLSALTLESDVEAGSLQRARAEREASAVALATAILSGDRDRARPSLRLGDVLVPVLFERVSHALANGQARRILRRFVRSCATQTTNLPTGS